MIVFTFCALLLSGICLANPVSDNDELLQQYVNNIQSQIDDTITPCEDFGKYACGKLKVDETLISVDQLNQLVEKQLNNNENLKSDDGQMVRRFYMSCKTGYDITKIFEQNSALKSVATWPVTRDFSDQEIAKLFGYLATVIPNNGFVSINFQNLNVSNIIQINLGLSTRSTDNENLLTSLEKFGVNSEERPKIIENISTLIKQLQNVEGDVKDDKLNNVAALKKAVPHFDWDIFFATFSTEFDLDINDFIKKTVQIQDMAKLKKIVNIIKATDSKTVVNYIIWMYILAFKHFNCFQLVRFMYPLIAIQNMKNENEYLNFFTKELDAFKNFEKSISELKPQISHLESDALTRYLKIKKYGYENYEKFLSGKYFSKLFTNVEINEKTFFTNSINVMHITFKGLVYNNEEFLAFTDFLMYPATQFVLRGKQPKSSLQHFVIDNAEFWFDIYRHDKYENRTISDECLPFENKTDNIYKNLNYLKLHAAYHIGLQEYLHFNNDNTDAFKKQTETLTAAGLNHRKAYMLALAQEKCEISESKNLNVGDENLLWFFKHSKEFSDTWGCKIGDAMYKVCDDSSFVTNFEK